MIGYLHGMLRVPWTRGAMCESYMDWGVLVGYQNGLGV